MKKIILIFVVLVMMVPNLALAVWWNPISWFRKVDTRDAKIEVVKNKISDEIVATSTELNKTASSSNDIKVSEVKKEIKPTVKPNIDNSSIIQAEVQRQLQVIFKAKQEQDNLITQQKAESDRQARIDAIKKQQAIDRANEEARDAKLHLDAQVEEAQEKLEKENKKLGEENKLAVEIESQIISYLQKIEIQILEVKQKIAIAKSVTSSASVPTTGCQGIITGNGCVANHTVSYNVSNSINGSILAQLAQRRDELIAIQSRLNQKGINGITENDKKFLTSIGISW